MAAHACSLNPTSASQNCGSWGTGAGSRCGCRLGHNFLLDFLPTAPWLPASTCGRNHRIFCEGNDLVRSDSRFVPGVESCYYFTHNPPSTPSIRSANIITAKYSSGLPRPLGYRHHHNHHHHCHNRSQHLYRQRTRSCKAEGFKDKHTPPRDPGQSFVIHTRPSSPSLDCCVGTVLSSRAGR